MTRHPVQPRLYVANPKGFFVGGDEYLERMIKPLVRQAGFVPVEPFSEADKAFDHLKETIGQDALEDKLKNDDAWTRTFIGQLNERLIGTCCAALAILEAGPSYALDGSPRKVREITPKENKRGEHEVDLGTGVEIGIFGEIAKRRYFRTIGVRLTAVDAGEPGQPVNLQCGNSVRVAGGRVARSLAEAGRLMAAVRQEIEALTQKGTTDPLKLRPLPTEWDDAEYRALQDLDAYWDQSEFAGPKRVTTRRYRHRP